MVKIVAGKRRGTVELETGGVLKGKKEVTGQEPRKRKPTVADKLRGEQDIDMPQTGPTEEDLIIQPEMPETRAEVPELTMDQGEANEGIEPVPGLEFDQTFVPLHKGWRHNTRRSHH